jgi:hypothetical protein
MEVARVRKKDFKITLDLIPSDAMLAQQLAEAIHLIVPSFLSSRIKLEVYQPIFGNIHQTIMEICQRGLRSLVLETLMPELPEFDNTKNCGHLAYFYETGRVTEQETQMCKDGYFGDQFLVHFLLIEFEKAHIKINQYDQHPSLSLVAGCGSQVQC